MILDVTRQYLEIKELKSLVEVEKPNVNCVLNLLNPPDYQLNKFLYKQIGKKHRWIDRLNWSEKQWIDFTTNSRVKTYILMEKDKIVGFFEQIINDQENEIELAYFGILEDFHGKKYGGYLLSEAIKLSLNNKIKRVWVHTCSLDHENALKNYLARGMKIFKTEKIKLKGN